MNLRPRDYESSSFICQNYLTPVNIGANETQRARTCAKCVANSVNCVSSSGMANRLKFGIYKDSSGYQISVPPSMTTSGKRERHFFRRLADAKVKQKELKANHQKHGTSALTIKAALAEDATKAQEMLAPFNVSLVEVAKEYISRRKAAGSTVPLRDAWKDYILNLEEKGRSEPHIRGHERTFKIMPGWFLDREVASIEGKDLEKALDQTIKTRPVARGTTWNRRLRETRSVLNWAKNTEAKENRGQKKAPKILKSNDQARKLMQIAEEEGCALPFALMLFAGIRPSGELLKISLDSIRKKRIYISPDQSKTGTDRQIPISENLRLWIDAWDQETILPAQWKRKTQAVRKAAGISGEQDILRHTFGSHFYRIHGEEETLQAMGHTSFRTFESHYRRAVSLERAQEFFTIAPGGASCAAPEAIRVA